MSKRFKNKTCSYCGALGSSQTGDHVFAREFLPVEHRDNLPQVPACEPCNGAKAKVEHYLLMLLPFAGNHPESTKILTDSVPRRLAKNAKLHRQLAGDRGKVWVQTAGVITPSTALPFDGGKLSELFVYVARGLAYFHWNALIPSDYHVGAGILTTTGESFLAPLLAQNAAARVTVSLGGGLIEYEGLQAVDDPCFTIWRLKIYGGMMFLDADRRGQGTANIWAMSARLPLGELFPT